MGEVHSTEVNRHNIPVICLHPIPRAAVVIAGRRKMCQFFKDNQLWSTDHILAWSFGFLLCFQPFTVLLNGSSWKNDYPLRQSPKLVGSSVDEPLNVQALWPILSVLQDIQAYIHSLSNSSPRPLNVAPTTDFQKPKTEGLPSRSRRDLIHQPRSQRLPASRNCWNKNINHGDSGRSNRNGNGSRPQGNIYMRHYH